MKTKKIMLSGPVMATVRPPGSKSITNRALICAALADGRTTLTGALDSEDTLVMFEALRTLGLDVTFDRDRAVMVIEGQGGTFPVKNAEIYVGNSGTTTRFLAAALAVAASTDSASTDSASTSCCDQGNQNDCHSGNLDPKQTHCGCYRIFGKPRMHERPIGDLIAALRQLGANIRSESENDCPPIVITQSLAFGGAAEVPGNISSQFLSALLLAAPACRSGVNLTVCGELVSKPYIEMTLAVMRAFGASIDVAVDYSHFSIGETTCYGKGQKEKSERRSTFQYDIEPDASAASYFFAAAAVTGGTVTVEGLSQNSLQGDIGFCRCLEQMGCDVVFGENSTTVTGHRLHGVTVDMNAISDTVMTLGVVALFAEGTTRITHVEHIRYKETDRIAALACELRKFGVTVNEYDDGLEIIPAQPTPTSTDDASLPPAIPIEIDTYDDHRMAMSFAIAGLKTPNVVIRDPNCVAKTYPNFFDDLGKIRTDSGR